MGLTLEKQFNKMFSTRIEYDSTTKEVGEESDTNYKYIKLWVCIYY